MDHLAPVATISPFTPQRSQKQWHRQSLPSPNLVHVQPASPEVISSLISSLSANFDDLPTPTPSGFVRTSEAPSNVNDLYEEDGSTSMATSFGIEYGAHNSSSQLYEYPHLHPLDAAIPPVVPTSKPRSGRSSLAASKRSSLNFPLRSNSRASLSRAGQEAGILGSIGNLSIEPAYMKPFLGVVGGEKRQTASLRSQKSLVSQLSREGMRQMDQKRQQNPINPTKGKSRDVQRPSQRNTQVSSQDLPFAIPFLTADDEVHPPGLKSNLPTIPSRASSAQAIADGFTPGNLSATSTETIGNRRTIPLRESSLRHSLGSTPSRRKNKPRRSDHGTAHRRPNTYFEVDGAYIDVTRNVPNDPEEDDVSRRIQELRALKELRRHQLTDDAIELPLTGQVQSVSPPSPQLSERPWLEIQSTPATSRVPRTFESSRNSPRSEFSARGPSTRSMSSGPECSPKSPELVSPLPKQSRLGIQRSSTFQPRRVTSPPTVISPDAHKRAFSNPLSQIIQTSQYDDRPPTADSIDDAVHTYLSAARLSQKIRHPQTDRIISFSEVGDPDGFTVFCCVGMGLTRYLTAFYDELASTLKLRLITPDRPGVGESEAYVDGSDTPLGWPDDVLVICQHLRISRFSLLAHSAGAIYALATALRMPQYIRGRIHLLAPWIPPSQLSAIGTHQEPLPVNALPYSQRFLRSLPTTFLKAANSSFLSATSASITTSLPKSPRRAKRKSLDRDGPRPAGQVSSSTNPRSRQSSASPRSQASLKDSRSPDGDHIIPEDPGTPCGRAKSIDAQILGKERQADYDTRLTHAIWDMATTNANPAVDLLVCLERRQSIGFRYVDINKAVVIHHGTRDTRVPLVNAKWLGKTMRKCEVRVLEGEEHGLMASAGVMGNVLVEMAKEWEDWNRVVQGKKGHPKRETTTC